jgi:hypothetical protein
MFEFPLECSANPRQKQLLDRTELVQNQYYLPEITQNLYQLRQTGLVQVLSVQAESFCIIGPAREVGFQRSDCRNVRQKSPTLHDVVGSVKGHL